ncbi:carbonyl reductase [NADPH] 1-like [Epargyreus clarus]|uniref:carbonyl reductase [NADPH] 1-like n=1 Tax=Epargyreus clarus TaxID=520877 RepID=UPI003C30C7A3
MSSNPVAIVTGSNKGLGFAIVKGLCERFKGTVYLTSRDEERGRKACEKLREDGLNPEYHQLDVTDTESVVKFIVFLKQRHEKIDLLINNAGILFLKDAKETKLQQAEQTVFVNFISLVTFTEAIIPIMNDKGNIINISSSSGHLSRIPSEELRNKIKSPDLQFDDLVKLMNDYVEAVKLGKEVTEGWGESPYVVSKVAVNAYTFMLNQKLSDRGILVNCVHPGYVISDMTKGAGNVTPEDAAEVPLKVALNPQAGGQFFWHNGQTVPWDGPDPRGYIDGKV